MAIGGVIGREFVFKENRKIPAVQPQTPEAVFYRRKAGVTDGEPLAIPGSSRRIAAVWKRAVMQG